MNAALYAAAGRAEEEGDADCASLLRVLGNATSLHLQVYKPAEPYCPMMVLQDRRTAALEDFGEEECALLRRAYPFVNSELRARIADICWLRERDAKMASAAVSDYLVTAEELEDPEQWPPAVDRLERAAQIARSLGKESRELAEVREALSAMLERHSGSDPLFLTARLIELLLEYGGGDPREFARIADRVATGAREDRDWHRAHTYRELAAACLRAAGQSEEAEESRVAAAQILADQATAAAEEGSPFVAAAHLDRAIQALRRIPGTKAQVDRLHERMLEYQRESAKEMKSISFEVDTKDLTESALKEIQGKSWEEAFTAFGLLKSIPSISGQRAAAEKVVQDHPLQHLFSSMRVDEEGRVMARRPGMSPENSDGFEVAVRTAMYQHACFRQSLVATASIEPARRLIVEEHGPSVEDILPLLHGPFVQNDRRHTLARGLAAGFEGEYLVAMHLLIPQVEHSVRQVFRTNGHLVTGLDNFGIQRERDLNYLLYRDAADDILTPEVAFDLRALLVDAEGSNLRNRMAHGLIPDQGMASPEAAYLWWCTIFLIVAFQMVEAGQATDPGST